MCIVIDANVFGAVFSEDDQRHEEFAPVKEWIMSGRGAMVYGGTKYKKEILEAPRRQRFVRLLRDSGKAIAIADCTVDQRHAEVERLTQSTDCDDQHIVALLGVSRCPLLCSGDKRSFAHIKNRDLYPKGAPKIKIYSSSRNSRLLGRSFPDKLTNSI